MSGLASCREAVLLVDEQNTFLTELSALLYTSRVNRVFTLCDHARIISFMAATPVAVVVFGLYPPVAAGLELLGKIRSAYPGVRVVVVSPLEDCAVAVACMKAGADEYLVRTADLKLLVKSILRDLEKSALPGLSSGHYREKRDTPEAFIPIVTQDRKMLTIFRYVEAVAPTSQAVLITGETGTGKELIAQALHAASRRTGQFITINVAGLDDILFSDTLFGHSRGAFTGAERERKGLIEQAAGGTLFLDEIGDLSNASQVKLLRLLQEGEYYPLGSDSVKKANARILVATNSPLDIKMKNGSFRSDLYYRICSHHIHLPALRERPGDIPFLVEHFSSEAAAELHCALPYVAADILDMLVSYEFPGNIRELKGLIHNAVATSAGKDLRITKLEPRSQGSSPARTTPDYDSLPRPEGRMPTLSEAEDYLIREALRVSGGNQRSAAVMLGISRQALNKRLLRNPGYFEAGAP